MVRAPLLLACVLATLLAAAPNQAARAEQLLATGGFEDGVSGWQAMGGRWSQAPGLGLGGTAAGALTIDPGPTARGYQPVTILSGGSYQLSGRLLAIDGDVQWAQLNVALRSDGGFPDRATAGQLVALYARQGSTAWTVAFEAGPHKLTPGCLNRTVRVIGLDDLNLVPDLVSQLSEYLHTAGLTVGPERMPMLQAALEAVGVTRVCAIGRMQYPSAGSTG